MAIHSFQERVLWDNLDLVRWMSTYPHLFILNQWGRPRAGLPYSKRKTYIENLFEGE